MAIPMTFLSPGRSHGYDLTWIVFGYIVGVHHPPSIHHYCWGNNSYNNWNFNWYSIRIISYKTNILNISKPSNGFYYGLFTGTPVYLIFAIPVEQFVLNPEFEDVLSSNKEPPESTEHSTTTTTTFSTTPSVF